MYLCCLDCSSCLVSVDWAISFQCWLSEHYCSPIHVQWKHLVECSLDCVIFVGRWRRRCSDYNQLSYSRRACASWLTDACLLPPDPPHPIAAPAAGGVHTATRATHKPPPALTPALPNFAGPSPRHLPRPPDVPHRPTGGTTAATPRRPQTVTAAGPATAPGRRAINLGPEEN